MDEEEKKQILSEHLKALGAKGGAARAKKLGKKKLSDSAKKAAQARWGKKKPAKQAARPNRKLDGPADPGIGNFTFDAKKAAHRRKGRRE